MKPLQPLRIADIGLAPRHVLGVARVDKKHGKSPGVEKLEDRNPVNTGRFHDNGFDAAFGKPVTNRWRSAVKVPKLRTGSGARSAPTAAICIVAPMSMAAAFGCTIGILPPSLDFDRLGLIRDSSG
jgi:hypothetical protein